MWWQLGIWAGTGTEEPPLLLPEFTAARQSCGGGDTAASWHWEPGQVLLSLVMGVTCPQEKK